MGRKTGISWTDHTFNPWWGCQRVSPGCENCYAETLAKRMGYDIWGPSKTTERRLFGERHWAEPLSWNRAAQKAGVKHKVFTASMADIFEDHPQLEAPRQRLFKLVEDTPWLTWQFLTKRPESIRTMLPPGWRQRSPGNVWMGISAETQEYLDSRMPSLNPLYYAGYLLWLSYEPALGPINFMHHAGWLTWIVIGGESGKNARQFNLGWARDTIRQCRESGVWVFVKQLGAQAYQAPWTAGDTGYFLNLRDRHGADMNEWPDDLKVREFPE